MDSDYDLDFYSDSSEMDEEMFNVMQINANALLFLQQ
jgi:hypothetical protein